MQHKDNVISRRADQGSISTGAQIAQVPRRNFLGYDIVAGTPEEFARRIKVEIDLWAKVIYAVGRE